MRKIYLLSLLILFTSCSSPLFAKPTSTPTATPKPTSTFTRSPTLTPTLDSIDNYPELKAYQEACSTPKECAQWLIDHGWVYEDETLAYGEGKIPSPARSLKKMAGECGTIAYAVAAGVVDDGYEPNFLSMVSTTGGHMLYLYQDSNGLWGYIQLLIGGPDQLIVDNHDPSFETIKDLFAYYNTEGNRPSNYYKYYFITKENVPTDWLTTQDFIEAVNRDTIQTGP